MTDIQANPPILRMGKAEPLGETTEQERIVAAAIFAVDEHIGPIRMNVPFSSLYSYQQGQYLRYARAAIAALSSGRSDMAEA
jgi:hypothetical protein